MQFSCNLGQLVSSLDYFDSIGEIENDSVITGLSFDSREIKPGYIYFAIRGANIDGQRFIQDAISAGAKAVVTESLYESFDTSGAPLIIVEDARAALSRLSSRFYQQPSKKLCCIGITGTNGKTSLAWLLSNLIAKIDAPCASVGTLGCALVEDTSDKPGFVETPTTSPDPITIQSFLGEILEKGAKAVAIEATSQGIAQHRCSDIDWDAAVFTNLSRDHLDLHGTLERYTSLKYRLFSNQLASSSAENRSAIFNIDDPVGLEFYQNTLKDFPDIFSVGVSLENEEAKYRVLKYECSPEGTTFDFSINGNVEKFHSKLLGNYNVWNLATALAVLDCLGYSLDKIKRILPEISAVPGRLEPIGESEVHVFVDYAHTPDALINAQKSLRELGNGRLITVFGCGGDRDKGKRPLMGQAVASMADFAVVTSDNPRCEDPDSIITDIIPGIEATSVADGFKYRAITDRKEAIDFAISEAEPGDIVLVAGKGHEPYQEVNGVKHHFLDSEICCEIMKEKGLL